MNEWLRPLPRQNRVGEEGKTYLPQSGSGERAMARKYLRQVLIRMEDGMMIAGIFLTVIVVFASVVARYFFGTGSVVRRYRPLHDDLDFVFGLGHWNPQGQSHHD